MTTTQQPTALQLSNRADSTTLYVVDTDQVWNSPAYYVAEAEMARLDDEGETIRETLRGMGYQIAEGAQFDSESDPDGVLVTVCDVTAC